MDTETETAADIIQLIINALDAEEQLVATMDDTTPFALPSLDAGMTADEAIQAIRACERGWGSYSSPWQMLAEVILEQGVSRLLPLID